MGKTTKKAELVVDDADRFPIESLREKLARRYGLDAVALSGPCEGAPIVDCVCEQLQKRWDRIKDRFANQESKIEKLAFKLAQSLLEKDDATDCVADLERMGFTKEAANGVTEYLKAWHVDRAMDDEMNEMVDAVAEETDDDDQDDLGGLDMDAEEPEFVEEEEEIKLPGEEDMEEEEEIHLPPGAEEETVTIELPASVAEELVNAIEGYEHEVEEIEEVPPGEGDMDFEIIELEEEPGDEMLEVKEETPEIPGESMEDGKQLVETERENACALAEAQNREAGMLRAGHIRKVGQSILKIGPEMSINNTDQQAGGKDLGTAKEKDVEDPKPLDQSNIKPEGYMAGGKKVQDGKTMGNEAPFKAHEVEKAEVSGGEKSILGEDESMPEGKPEVPAGSAPIGGEEQEGGNVSTKGTVIATLLPDGILCKAEGHDRPVKVRVKITEASKELVEAIGKIPYDGDLKKFALAAGKLVRAKCVVEDGVCKTDTSKLEAEKFTNDGEKKPEEGAVAGTKGKSAEDKVTTTDTSKLEAEKFTNDGEKKAEGDKAASSGKAVKTAQDKVVKHHEGDKTVEDPKPLDKSNIKPEGYMAGGKQVSAPDGSVQGSEEKFKAHEVEKAEVSGGEKSILGEDESMPEGKAEVPVGKGQMGNEELDGNNVATKGTVIAETQGADSDELQRARNEGKIREARLKAAAVVLADQLLHGEVTVDEYKEKLEEYAQMDVPSIQALGKSIVASRKRVEAKAKKETSREGNVVVNAGMGIPVVPPLYSENDQGLRGRLEKLFSINNTLSPDSYDANGRPKKP